MSQLFSPITIRDLEIKNRLWVSPMCQYSCENQDGIVGNWHLVHLGARATGGAGLVVTEATAVSPEGRISPWDAGIWNRDQQQAWIPITEFIRSQGAASVVQLAHAGRKASVYREWSGSGAVSLDEGGWQTVAPSEISFGELPAPKALDASEISQIVSDFASAAKRSMEAGFDGVEIHAAHGYLIHQFLSPISNQRQDEYGGSLENRARLLTEITKAVRESIGESALLLIRFSGTDFVENGWDQAQTAIVAGWCYELGADLFDISGGGLITGTKIPVGPGYQVPYAEFVKSNIESGSVAAVGRITEAEHAEALVASGAVDVVMVGREFLRDPHFGLRAAHQLGAEVSWPNQYTRGYFN